MASERSNRAIEVLLDDAIRLGGLLTVSHIDRVLDRRNLDPTDCLDVYHALEERGVIDGTDLDEEVAVPAGNSPNHETPIDSAESAEEQDELSNDESAPEFLEPSTESLNSLTNEFVDHSLLTPEEEVTLGRAVALGRQMEIAVNTGAVPSSAHALEAVRRGREAREMMIRSNLRLVMKVAYPYTHLTLLELDDLVQEGVLGLIRAVEKFDHSKGFRFSTYAFWWIRQSITRALADKGDTIRLPVHMKEKLNRVRKAIRTLRRFNGDKHPSVTELSDELDWPTEQVQFLLDLSRVAYVSADAPGEKDGDIPLVDTIADDKPDPSEIVSAHEKRNHIAQMLGTLSERERDIIMKRFGLNRIDELTLEQIGVSYGLTRERIRQIESKALKKLRFPSISEHLRSMLDQ